jgi:hypothetical protein
VGVTPATMRTYQADLGRFAASAQVSLPGPLAGTDAACLGSPPLPGTPHVLSVAGKHGLRRGRSDGRADDAVPEDATPRADGQGAPNGPHDCWKPPGPRRRASYAQRAELLSPRRGARKDRMLVPPAEVGRK